MMPVEQQGGRTVDGAVDVRRERRADSIRHGEVGLRYATIEQSIYELQRLRVGLRAARASCRARAYMMLREEQSWWAGRDPDYTFSLASCCAACGINAAYLRAKVLAAGLLDPVRMEDCGITRLDIEQAIIMQCHPGKRFHAQRRAA